jgi:hypothetical protein
MPIGRSPNRAADDMNSHNTMHELDNSMLELIIINYNMYVLICNKYILYNGLSNYTHNEVIKFCIGVHIYAEILLYGRPYICRDTVVLKTILIFPHFLSPFRFPTYPSLSLLTQFQKKKNCRRRSSQSLHRIRGRSLEG